MKVLIVGGVAGGAGAAARLRRNDEFAEIIIFEKGEYISFANCGLPYYLGGEIKERDDLMLQTPDSFRKRFAVDVRVRHEVTAVDPERKEVAVTDHKTGLSYRESYDKLILSPGAKPVIPELEPMDTTHSMTLRSLSDAYKLYDYIKREKPRSCAVVGGGFIGLEITENLLRRGLKVSLIEAGSHVMPALDGDMAEELHSELKAQGVSLYRSRICHGYQGGKLSLDDGHLLDADFIVLCTGIKPDTDFLDGSGVRLGDRGQILINHYMETSVPDIYALGDAASVPNIISGEWRTAALASPAARQARLVADGITGERKPYQGCQNTAILRLFEKTAAVTGLNEETLKRLEIPYRKSYTYSLSHAGYYPGASMMGIKLLFSPEAGAILGAQIVGGEGVDKRIDVIAAAVRLKKTVYDLQEMELAYAPPYSSSKDPVQIAGCVAGNILEGKMIPFYVEELDSLPQDGEYIDVRTAQEFAAGSIPGFRNLPLDELRQRITEINLSKPVYITCQIGLRGYLAQRILMQHGAVCRNLSGGYRLYSSAAHL